jgi:hypothetical protein
MKLATVLARTSRIARVWRTRAGACAVLAENAHIPSRCRVRPLPADFVPGHSLYSTVERIRQQHSNYHQLLAELLLACSDSALSGHRCALSQHPALAPHWCRCPLLSPLRYELRKMADEKAEQAFIHWRRRTRRQAPGH